jgi:polyferredoxin
MAVRRIPRLLRPRTLMYTAVLSVVAAIMVAGFLTRDTLSLSILRDRAPLFVPLSDGSVRNAFTIKLVNKTHETARYTLVLEGAPGVTILAQGAQTDRQGRPILTTRPDGITEWRVLATAPAGRHLPANLPISFHLHDQQGHDVAHAQSVLLGPAP